jgi:hypothetical protein
MMALGDGIKPSSTFGFLEEDFYLPESPCTVLRLTPGRSEIGLLGKSTYLCMALAGSGPSII